MTPGKNHVAVKFGGSVFPPDRLYEGFSQAADYLLWLRGKGYTPVPVVSAPKGVSDLLIDAYQTKDLQVDKKLMQRYESIMGVNDELGAELGRMHGILRDNGEDRFLALGENHAGLVLSGMLRKKGANSSYCDGLEAGVRMSGNRVDVDGSIESIRINWPSDDDIHVMGGYVGRSEGGNYKIMGRNSTDVTMSLAAVAVNAAFCENIKDTPVRRLQPTIEFNGEEPIEIETSVIKNLSYNEALHMGSRQSEILHPVAVKIARDYAKDIFVKQLGNNEYTRISLKSGTTPQYPVAAVSARVCNVMSISDSSMNLDSGIGYIHAVSGAFEIMRISILDMTGPGSTMSFIFPTKHDKTDIDSDYVKDAVGQSLAVKGFSPDDIRVDKRVALSIVGDAMSGRSGVLRKVLEPFEQCGVSIRMASQSDEAESPPCIDLYIDPDREQTERALRSFCKTFKFFNDG